MAQAKVLTEKDVRRVLLYIAAHKHPTRNRAMFLMTTNCGMRVGAVAARRGPAVLIARPAAPGGRALVWLRFGAIGRVSHAFGRG